MVELGAGERLGRALDQLGVSAAHFAFGVLPIELAELAELRPEMLASVTAVLPVGLPEVLLAGRPASVVLGRSQPSAALRDRVAGAARVHVTELPDDYEAEPWSDVASDQGELLTSAIAAAAQATIGTVEASSGEHIVEGIRLQVQGAGPPLVLLPGGIWPNQWGPVVDRLAARFTVITASGAHLGMFARLEGINAGAAAIDLMETMYRRLAIGDGDAVLDVGAGPGTHVRDLAQRHPTATFAALEPNAHFLDEAQALARIEGTADRVRWERGVAEELPFDDASFDAAFTIRVLEECDADAALDELQRVLRPGGRVGIVVRATDRPRYVGYDLAADQRERAEAPGGPVAARGCADASIYRRVARRFGDVMPWPSWHTEAPMTPATVSLQFAPELHEPLLRALEEDDSGAGFFALPLHCVVATKR